MKQAAILDIGSNSIRYACGRLDADGHAVLEPKQIRTTRLAEGLDASGRLSEAAMRRSLEAIAAFATDAACRGLPLFAYATSAVRDSANRADFCGRAAALGVEIEILGGEDEARLARLGATGGLGGVIDIGGGSTQIIRADFAHSAPIGCVRARELCAAARSLDQMKRAVFGRCEEILRFPAEKSHDYVGLGGTILPIAALMRGLTAYDPVKACEMRICHTALDELVEWLYDLGDAGRSAQPLLVESERVDTLLPGALILVFVMAHTGAGEIAVSERDGMEGYLMKKLGS